MDYDSDLIFPREQTGRDAMVRNGNAQGKVIEQCVDDTRCNVRVQFLDKDGFVTKPIPVLQPGGLNSGSFYCPEVGDDVNVQFGPNGETGDAYVNGSFYNVGNPPPTTDPNDRRTRFKDGAVFNYNQESHILSIDTPGPITIKTSGPVTLEADTVTIKASKIRIEGEVEIEGSLKVTEDITSEQNIRAAVYLYDQRGIDHN